MKKILAHSEADAKRRRSGFEERLRDYIGRQFTIDQIKRVVNSELEVKYLRGYLRKGTNPVLDLSDGKAVFSQQRFLEALKNCKADLTRFRMEVYDLACDSVASPLPDIYDKRTWIP